MAKNSNTKKEIVAEEVENEINVEKVENEIKVEEVKEKPKTRRKFGMNDLILCKSVTFGELLLPGRKSQLLYRWMNYGDFTEVEYQDLQALRSMSSAYLKKPYFIIMDEELLEQWPDLKTINNKLMDVDLDRLFTLPINQFKKQLKEFPSSYQSSIKNIASSKILNGELDSISKIKAIDEILGTELMLYIQ